MWICSYRILVDTIKRGAAKELVATATGGNRDRKPGTEIRVGK